MLFSVYNVYYTMTQALNVLIVEDHQLIIDSYVRALKHISEKRNHMEFIIGTANDCDSANTKIEEAVNGRLIDLVLLDISLPPSKNGKIVSGDDLGLKLRHLFPKVKIIVATHLTNNYRLVNILKNLKPEGLLIKSDLTFKDLTEGIIDIIHDVPYYSKAVLKLIRQHISNNFNLDNVDRQMLYHLSQGTKTKELPIIHLSIAGIERRKRRLNQIFNNERKSDKALLKLAKKSGFL